MKHDNPAALGGRRATEVFRVVIEGGTSRDIPLRDFLGAFEERAFGFLLVLLSLPNCVPAPPGLGSILGLPVLLVAAQMVVGRRVPWFPRAVLDRVVSRDAAAKVLAAAQPRLAWLERICRPRGRHIFTYRIERLIGVFVALCALMVLIPLPLTNMIPALGTAIIGVAILEEDALVLAFGVAVGVIGIMVGSVAILAFTAVAGALVSRLFGI